jgi:hypothetical protein
MIVRLTSDRTAYRMPGGAITALLLMLAACAPVPPAPAESAAATPVMVVPTADARALAAAARRDAHDRLWAAITVSPEVLPGGPTFVGAGPDASRVLGGVGCRFAVLNGGTTDRRFTGLRLAVEITARIGGHPVTNSYHLATHGFTVPAGGAMRLGPADLAADGPGSFEYQVGGGWEGESWGRVYHGPLASQDAFISADVSGIGLTLIDPTVGASAKGFPVTGCRLSA